MNSPRRFLAPGSFVVTGDGRLVFAEAAGEDMRGVHTRLDEQFAERQRAAFAERAVVFLRAAFIAMALRSEDQNRCPWREKHRPPGQPSSLRSRAHSSGRSRIDRLIGENAAIRVAAFQRGIIRQAALELIHVSSHRGASFPSRHPYRWAGCSDQEAWSWQSARSQQPSCPGNTVVRIRRLFAAGHGEREQRSRREGEQCRYFHTVIF